MQDILNVVDSSMRDEALCYLIQERGYTPSLAAHVLEEYMQRKVKETGNYVSFVELYNMY